jgi:hypothetical protein
MYHSSGCEVPIVRQPMSALVQLKQAKSSGAGLRVGHEVEDILTVKAGE